VSALNFLSILYVQVRKLSWGDEQEFGSAFFRGHLSVLLGLLMRGSLENEKLLRMALPDGIGGLANDARDFMGWYTDFMSRISKTSQDDEGQDEDEEAGQAPLGSRFSGAGNNVISEVVRFLDALNDEGI
jgi:hypothetical protein